MTNPAPLIPHHSSASLQAVSSSRAHRVAVVGDVHDLWDEAEEGILRHLGVDLVLLVGDFGNEAVEVVRAVAQLDLPKAVILGNHDAWFTATAWGRGLRGTRQDDRVQQQLDLLGAAHVGYGKLDFPQFGFSVVGSRPFSWGGSTWKNGSFYQQRFGIDSFAASTAKIVAAAASTTSETVLFIGHCGPKGLGEQPEDPCGKDWNPIGGDYGDPDFTAAIEQTRALGKHIPLVAFGHMHHQLRHTKTRLRKMVQVDNDGTVYLNAASVPRIVQTSSGRSRNFSLVTLVNGVVTDAALVWVQDDFTIQSQQILYQAAVRSRKG
ncbi:MAG: TIGR04168 family protein [Cyanobacteria bacterium RM1_2_2]|nr:TIGR04168 family protein [Cyanobacteria bacterium RM1_2_2]